MNRITLGGAALTLTALLGLVSVRPTAWTRAQATQDRPYGIKERVPWKTSRLTGSPDPPHPCKVERAFPKLRFRNPLLLVAIPGTDRLVVGEQAGKLHSFRDRPDCDRADLMLDLTKELRSWDPKKVRGIEALYGRSPAPIRRASTPKA
jgi:hypothetical protein